MKKKHLILTHTLILFLLSTVVLSAQRYNDYDYDDNVIIVTDYGNDNVDYRNDQKYRKKGKRNRRRVSQERQWKAKMMNHAWAIAEADGRVTKRERREIRHLERDLGLSRRGKRGNKGNHRNHGHQGDKYYR